MKYWLDTEFIEDGKTIDLISIGIVAEDGREYYAVNLECDYTKASDWVWENVLYPMGLYAPLPFYFPTPGTAPMTTIRSLEACKMRRTIRNDLVCFFGIDEDPKIWAYYAATDWVAFYQIWGTLMDLPKTFPKYCRDIKQECDRLGNPQLPKKSKGAHNALEDARWNKKAWEFLKQIEEKKP